MKRAAAALLVAIAAIAAMAGPGHYNPTVSAQQEPQEPREPTSGPRAQATVTFLQINDVYSTVPIDGIGGLARVATLKQQIAASGRAPVLVLAGDFLSPSVSSSVFKGEQMIAALNAAGLDLATLGNHEFDFGEDVLIQRMREAKWQWVVSNVTDLRTGKPIGGAAPYFVRTYGTLKVGFIGLCLNTSEIDRQNLTHTRLDDPIASAARYVPILEREGAQAIVAITHLAYATDRALLEKFPRIALIIGGHEHYPITSTVNGTLVSKAGSDARFVGRIDLGRRPNGSIERFFELLPVTSALADEPRTAAVISGFESRLSTELDKVVGNTTVPLETRDQALRASETNIGNYFADAMRSDVGADVALMNSGSIRGNRVFSAGPITRRTIVALHPFGNVVCKISLSGQALLDALNNGVSGLPLPAGRFPQVSGITLRVDVSAQAGSRVRDVRIGGQPLDLKKIYTLALPDYVLKGGDGYRMLMGQRVVVDAESGHALTDVLEKAITAQRTISPAVDGRITQVP
jgi:5'-nucleotidase